MGLHLTSFKALADETRLRIVCILRSGAYNVNELVGILGMVAGVAVVRHPFETVAVLATILGIVWIVSGSVDIISAIADSRLDDRGLFGLMGLLSLVAGITVVSWPGPTVTVIAWVAGIYVVVFGLTTVFGAFRMRSIAH